MANHKSAEKRNRQSQKRRARNLSVRSAVKTAVKKAREALATKDGTKIEEALRSAASTLDKAASKGVLHKGNASRRIARLRQAASASKA